MRFCGPDAGAASLPAPVTYGQLDGRSDVVCTGNKSRLSAEISVKSDILASSTAHESEAEHREHVRRHSEWLSDDHTAQHQQPDSAAATLTC